MAQASTRQHLAVAPPTTGGAHHQWWCHPFIALSQGQVGTALGVTCGRTAQFNMLSEALISH
jgi:hypothetical protein